MEIGMKVYFEKETGNVIFNTGERAGSVIPTTREQDFSFYKALAERVAETVGVIELTYRQYAYEFSEAIGYRVNPETKELEFAYLDPNADPGTPVEPVYQKPITDQFSALKERTEANEAAILALLDFGL
ncbi:hypothetical protein A3842_28070 [Paenibacillus sp. P3E]|uniref:hypothetical protein n=1 Tax=Paenibacillus sp. P3E TaxID=1349435 RepID=UPI000940069C|nr:hypothetical protein [Paenibacillus sp. P3E]OKP67562.1 hypothetical protein A3842_28070 [Paenibacillus sp. P3E]